MRMESARGAGYIEGVPIENRSEIAVALAAAPGPVDGPGRTRRINMEASVRC